MLWKILEKILILDKTFTRCKKTSRTLQIIIFKIPDNFRNTGYYQNIEKLFSKYEEFLLDQVNSSSDTSQILILQFPTSRPSLPLSPSLSYFTLPNWNPSSTQASSHSSPVSLYCPIPFDHTPSQLLDKLNHMRSLANQISYQAIYRS